MKKTLCLLALPLLLNQPVLAEDQNTAQILIGEWQCSQNLTPDEGINLSVEYIQLFTAQRNFTLDGSMKMKFTIAEMNQMLGGDSLNYLFEGSGNWSTKPGYVTIKTENATIKPNNPMAQQLHQAGILDVNKLREMKSEDTFIINSLTSSHLKLTHVKEKFTTQCTRTQ